MKQKVKKEIIVEEFFCNICKKPIATEPFNQARIQMVRGLFKIQDFHAHEGCINKVAREAFKKYI